MWQIKLILTDYAHLTIWASAHNESHAGMENQRDIKSAPTMTATPGTNWGPLSQSLPELDSRKKNIFQQTIRNTTESLFPITTIK